MFPSFAVIFILSSYFGALHIFFLISSMYYLNIYTSKYSNSKALLNKNILNHLYFVFLFIFFIHSSTIFYCYQWLVAPKKMCFISRAQLMEVLLYLLAGNYVSLLNSALCCNHGYVFLCCSMACWDQVPYGQYAIPNVVYYLQCVRSKRLVPFASSLSVCHYPAHLRKLHCDVAKCVEAWVMTQSLRQI